MASRISKEEMDKLKLETANQSSRAGQFQVPEGSAVGLSDHFLGQYASSTPNDPLTQTAKALDAMTKENQAMIQRIDELHFEKKELEKELLGLYRRLY